MSGLNRLVHVVQLLTAVATAAFVILLFVNEPGAAPAPPAAAANSGKAIFATRCASCHGTDGSGGFGPALAGVVVKQFPDPAAQITLVTKGRGSMPSFADSLTPAQIAAVVAYTRDGLG